MGVHVARVETAIGAYKSLSGHPEGIKLRRRSRSRWENVTEMDRK
jgi:hypothetical protein